MDVLKSLDSWLGIYAPWFDVAALFLVGLIATKRPSVIAFAVLIEFSLSLISVGYLRTLAIWPDVDLDYQYMLGVKDIAFASILFLLGANPLLTLCYLIAGALSWSLWYGYGLVYDYRLSYETWVIGFYLWTPVYFLLMWFEVLSLFFRGGDAGKRVRSKIIPIDWDRIFRPVYRALYRDIAPTNRRTEKAVR